MPLIIFPQRKLRLALNPVSYIVQAAGKRELLADFAAIGKPYSDMCAGLRHAPGLQRGQPLLWQWLHLRLSR